MPKIKTNELTGPALDWASATALGREPVLDMRSHGRTWRGWWLRLGVNGAPAEYERMPNYSEDGEQFLRIIEREWINLDNGSNLHPALWAATKYNKNGHPIEQRGPTAATAAWRCFVASKLGDEVDVPEELL